MGAQAAGHWLDAERLRVYPRLFLAVYLIASVVWVLLSHNGVDPKGKPLGYDFITFWSASRLALAGQPLAVYDLATLVATERAVVPGIVTAHPWQYPPTFLLMVLPLSLLPFLVSYWAFMTVTLAGYLAVLRRILTVPGSLMPLLAFPGLFLNFEHGQNAFLSGALIGAGLLLLPRRPLLAGVLFGLLSFKPHLGVLLPLVLLARREWRAIAAAAVTSLALLAASLGVFGSAVLGAFVDALPQVARWVSENALPLVKMPTAFAFVRLLGLPESLAWGLQSITALVAVVLVVRLWLRPVDPALRNAGLVVGSLLVSPYLFDYDLAWLALALAWIVDYGLRAGWRCGERELLLAVWLLPMLVAPFSMPTHLQLAPFVLLAFLLLIVRRAEDVAPVSLAPAVRDRAIRAD